MNLRRLGWEGDAGALAARLRAMTPIDPELTATATEIVDSVGRGGDRVLIDYVEQHDGVRLDRLQAEPEAITAALERLRPELRDALEVAYANIAAVARAQLVEATPVRLPQGHTVKLERRAVAAAGAYVPGGRAPYPSTVLMCVVPARIAGVERVAVATPPGPDGHPNDAILAACALAGADEVYAMGGAHAIGALAWGTESIPAVDVIVGPGNAWVQEAKLAVSRMVGIDGYAGPSELLVLLDGTAPTDWLAADLCAQAEHGIDAPLVACSPDRDALEALGEATVALAERRPSVSRSAVSLVLVPGIEEAIELVNAMAPEHVQLACADGSTLAARVRTAGCVFAGVAAATAFGDYAAGSNHVLPTGGAGRYTGPLGPLNFSRPISVVDLDERSATRLGPAVNLIAEAEGFPVHGESAMIRSRGSQGN